MKPALFVLFAFAPVLTMCSGSDQEIITVSNNGKSELHDIEKAPQFIKDVAKSTVLIDGNATASFVRFQGSEYLMTNHHVIGRDDCLADGCYAFIVTNYQRGENSKSLRLFLKPVAANPDTDVAFFSFKPLNKDYTPASGWTPEAFLTLEPHTASELVGQNIFVVGHPAAALKKYSPGKVMFENNRYVSTTSFAIGGNSGSPVVTESGTLVAIHHSGNQSITDLSQTAFNRVSRHSPTELLINVLKDGLARSSDARTFPFLYAKTASKFSNTELHRFAKARMRLPLPEGVTAAQYVASLQTECKSALDAHDQSPQTNAASYNEAIESCTNASVLIACQSTNPNPLFYCPATQEESLAWEKLFVRVSTNYNSFPGENGIVHLQSLLSDVYANQETNKTVTRNHIVEMLQQKNEPFSFRVATALIELNGAEQSISGTTPRGFVLSYTNQPYYWSDLGAIIWGVSALANQEVISQETLHQHFVKIAKDGRLSLRNALDLEAIAYEWGVLTW